MTSPPSPAAAPAAVAAGEGLAYGFDTVRPANTFDAHRPAHLVEEEDVGRADDVVEALMSAHFERGVALDDRDELAVIAERCGRGARRHRGGPGDQGHGRALLRARPSARGIRGAAHRGVLPGPESGVGRVRARLTTPSIAPVNPSPRPIASVDLPALAALNDAAVPAVSPLGLAGLTAHVPRCEVAVVIDDDAGVPVAFLLALAPGADYASENFRWFEAHRPGSLYVDRIVVAPTAHGRGLGRLLYATVAGRASELGLAEITCEVNLEPPNPQSLAFHARLGFAQVGEQVTKGGAVRVALLARDA